MKKLSKFSRKTLENKRAQAIHMLDYAECQVRKNADSPAALKEAQDYLANVNKCIDAINAQLA